MSRKHSLEHYENLHNSKFPDSLIKVNHRNGLYVYFETDFGSCRKLAGEIGLSNYDLQSAINKTTFFVNKVSKIHDNKYDYSKTVFINSRHKLIVICPIHGEFIQKANHHMSGHGCKKCATVISHQKVETRIYNWALKDWENNGENSKCFSGFKCYILKCWNDEEEFYKIGRTFQKIDRRFHGESSMPYNYEIIDLYIGSAKEAYTREITLKRANKKHKYIPKIDFGGKHECFKVVDI